MLPHHITSSHFTLGVMRIIIFLAAMMAAVHAHEGYIEDETPSSRRRIADQTVCEELQSEIVAGTATAAIEESCQCSDTSDGGTQLTCRRDNLCLASDGGAPMLGDFQTTFTISGSGTSYTQEITIEDCFTYPSDVNDGETVCVSSARDGMGTVATCEITVGGKACNICRYCPINLISFDCSNIGYEERTACGDDNANDSIVQFLYNPKVETSCQAPASSPNSSAASPNSAASVPLSPNMMPTATSPTGAKIITSMASGLISSLIPIVLMG